MATKTFQSDHASEILLKLNHDRKVDKLYNDVTLQVGSTSFPVHKCVIGSFSIFFKKMFSIEMREKYEKEATVKGVTEDIMEAILEFVYTGKIVVTSATVYPIIEAASYMQIPHLKKYCIEFFIDEMNVNNCLGFRIYAKQYDYKDVVKRSDEVIEEKFEEVVMQDEFKQLKCDDVCEVLQLDGKEVSSEEVVYLSMIEWIKHDVDSRRKCIDELFSCIDVDKLSWSFHADVVQKEDLIMDSLTCVKRCLCSKARMGPTDDEKKVTKNKNKKKCADGFVAVKGKKIFSYDLESKKLTELPDLSFDIGGGTAVNFNDELYIISGNKSVAKLDLADSMSEWVDMACTNEKRPNAAATVCGDFIYVSGGDRRLSSVERFDNRRNAWYNIRNMNSGRYYHAMVSAGAMLWAVGGWYTNTVECFDTHQDTWNPAPSMKYKRSYFAAAVLDYELYAIGGYNSGLFASVKLASVERYNTIERTWCDVANLNQPRSYHGACVVNGKIYVAGGNSATVEVYDPNENAWKIEAEIEALKGVHCIASTYQ